MDTKQRHSILQSIYSFLARLINIHDDSDAQATINNIEKSTEFRGDNVWILFCAIIIASVGLNVNSTAVIIGAMLISPVMGPIMGVGLSIGISDNDLLFKSLKNLLIMVGISLVASSIYFLLTPLNDAQSELLARTRPTIYDVFIAFFGGAAGIIASSRKQEKMTVVSGVAIATALMPPLCTAGYGIGTGQLLYFLGAIYLFFINSFFIALATFLMVRYLHFPPKAFLDPVKAKKVRRSLLIFSIIVIVPSVFTAVDVLRETSFNSQAIKYITDIDKSDMFKDVQIINSKRTYTTKKQTIALTFVGKSLTDDQMASLKKKLGEYGLEKANLEIRQTSGNIDINTQAAMLQTFIDKKELQLQQKDSLIQCMEEKLQVEQEKKLVTSEQLAVEVVALFPHIQTFSIGESEEININSQKKDTVFTVNIKWGKTPTKQENEQLHKWLKARLNTKKLHIIND